MDWRYLFFSLEGRITRKPYWIGSGVLIAVSLTSYFIQSSTEEPRLPLLILIDVALLYPSFAVMLKRAHDRDMSPVLPVAATLLSLIFYGLEFFGLTDDNSAGEYDLLLLPFLLITLGLIIYLIIILGFFKGTPGDNRFGPDPLAQETA